MTRPKKSKILISPCPECGAYNDPFDSKFESKVCCLCAHKYKISDTTSHYEKLKKINK